MSGHADIKASGWRSGMVRIPSEVVAKFWPLRTFVHHNPLIDLESLPSIKRWPRDVAVWVAGYLSCKVFRTYLGSGRIQPLHLDAAVAAIARDSYVELGTTRISHQDVLPRHPGARTVRSR